MTMQERKRLFDLKKIQFSTNRKQLNLKDYKYNYKNFIKKDSKFRKLKLHNKKFIDLETSSIEYSTFKYLIIRLDGVKFTERFFRKDFIPEKIIHIINLSIRDTYKKFNLKNNKNNKDFFLSIVYINDEISFIIRTGKNKYDNRVVKILSLLNGLMSTLSSNYYNINYDNKPTELYYDAKPFILKSTYEIFEYIEYRYLMGRKHIIGKTLKFNDILLESKNWKNLYFLEEKLKENKLEKELVSIENTFKIFIPNKNYDLNEYSLTEDLIDKDLIDLLNESNSQKKYS